MVDADESSFLILEYSISWEKCNLFLPNPGVDSRNEGGIAPSPIRLSALSSRIKGKFGFALRSNACSRLRGMKSSKFP